VARVFIIIATVYLFFGLALTLNSYVFEWRVFECGNSGVVWTQGGSFRNPDSERCVRRVLKPSYLASIPVQVLILPYVYGMRFTYHFSDNLIKTFTQYDAAYAVGRLMMLFHPAQEAHLIEVEDAAETYLSDIDTPAGWYQHRLSRSHILITAQKDLPDIGATEMYAYGDQVSVSIATTTLTPEEWMSQQEWLDDPALARSKVWIKLHGHMMLQVGHETEALPALTAYLFVKDLVYTISLYPYPGGKALGVFNDLVEKYSSDPSRKAISDAELAANCTKEVPPSADDTELDLQVGVVTFRWLDIEHDRQMALAVPYDPDSGFAGCSESVKERLRHIREAQDKGDFSH